MRVKEKRSNKCKNYLIARNYCPSVVVKQFEKAPQISRDNERNSRSKVLGTDSVNFVTSYNPVLANINSVIKNYLPIFHADFELKESFPRKSITAIYRRQKYPQRNASTIFLC